MKVRALLLCCVFAACTSRLSIQNTNIQSSKQPNISKPINVAITFDDLPGDEDDLRMIIKILEKHKVVSAV